MRRFLAFAFIVLVLSAPAASVDFEEMPFSDDGVDVYVQVSADVPWQAPFTEDVTVFLSVRPISNDSTWVRLSSVVVTLQRAEQDGTGYTMISSNVYDFAAQPEGSDYVNASLTVSLTGSGTGSQCFFATSIVGQYGNSTKSNSFVASSPENFIGPFSVSYGLASPVFIAGIGLIVLFSVVIILGMWGVRKSRSRPKRKTLLQE